MLNKNLICNDCAIRNNIWDRDEIPSTDKHFEKCPICGKLYLPAFVFWPASIDNENLEVVYE